MVDQNLDSFEVELQAKKEAVFWGHSYYVLSNTSGKIDSL